MKFNIDLHIHSKHSGDNDAEPEETVHHAIESHLDGIAFTEHYSYGASEYAEKLRELYADRIKIFRGVEFSSADGHCLVFGADTDRLPIRNVSIEEVVHVVNEQGGVVIPTHPYRGNNSVGEYIMRLNGICAIEGYNGYSHHSQNKKAIQAAEKLHLPFTGGSDAHASKEVGSCYTAFTGEVTYDNFIDMLKAGNYTGVDTRKISRAWPF